MYSEYKNLAPVEGTDWMSQNDLKQPKTITPRKLQRKIKAPKNYGFDMVSYVIQVVEEINSFKPTTYQVAISCYEQWL